MPVLMRARIDQIMQKQFNVIQADDELRSILANLSLGSLGVIPVVEKDGSLGESLKHMTF